MRRFQIDGWGGATVMRRALVWLGRITLVVAGLTALYFGAGFGLARVAVNTDFAPMQDGVPIGISSNGIHANLHFPVDVLGVDWTDVFPLDTFPHPPWQPETVSFGWGNRDFYLNTPTWADMDPWVGFLSIIGIGGTALHVAYWPPLREGDYYVVVHVSPDAYHALADHVRRTIEPDDTGNPVQIPGYSYAGNDRFYEADGTYSLFATCNEWVRRGLADAGIRTGVWSPFPAALLDHFRAARAVGR